MVNMGSTDQNSSGIINTLKGPGNNDPTALPSVSKTMRGAGAKKPKPIGAGNTPLAPGNQGLVQPPPPTPVDPSLLGAMPGAGSTPQMAPPPAGPWQPGQPIPPDGPQGAMPPGALSQVPDATLNGYGSPGGPAGPPTPGPSGQSLQPQLGTPNASILPPPQPGAPNASIEDPGAQGINSFMAPPQPSAFDTQQAQLKQQAATDNQRYQDWMDKFGNPQQSLSPDTRQKTEDAMAGLLRQVNQGDSGAAKGMRAGQWLFANIAAPMMAAHAHSPGGAQGAVDAMKQGQEQIQQDKINRQNSLRSHVESLSQLGTLLQRTDRTGIAQIAANMRAAQGQNQMQMAQNNAMTQLLLRGSHADAYEQAADLSGARADQTNQLTSHKIEDTDAQTAQRTATAGAQTAAGTAYTSLAKDRDADATLVKPQQGEYYKQNAVKQVAQAGQATAAAGAYNQLGTQRGNQATKIQQTTQPEVDKLNASTAHLKQQTDTSATYATTKAKQGGLPGPTTSQYNKAPDPYAGLPWNRNQLRAAYGEATNNPGKLTILHNAMKGYPDNDLFYKKAVEAGGR